MAKVKKLEIKLLKEASEIQGEDRKLARELWRVYKEDKEELKEIKHIDEYIAELKREINESINLIHKGALRKSSEHISKLRGKIKHASDFVGHLKKEQRKRYKEEKKIFSVIKVISKEISKMNSVTRSLVKGLGI